MDVVDRRGQRPGLNQIAIVAPSGLPEEPFRSSAADARDPGQPAGRVGLQEGDPPLADGLLDGFKDGRDPGGRALWPEDQVCVLGHKDVSPEVETKSAPRPVDRSREPVARPFRVQESVSSIAGEGQLMGLPRLIEATSTMGPFPIVHKIKLRPHRDAGKVRRLVRSASLAGFRGLEDETPATQRELIARIGSKPKRGERENNPPLAP
jgi:hypothetical protein